MDPHDTSVSKPLLQVRNAYNDEPSETWTDFLRNTSSTQPRANMNRPTHTDELPTATSDAHTAPSQRKRVASITHSAERKRSSGAFSQFSGIQGTRGYPIDLTSSPHQSSSSYNDSAQCLSTAQSERGSSSIVLPPWQADSDVDACPVCKDQFSWYFRKHHCRKCGKVVCANCSQHRITIPQQYIVQAPPHEQTAAALLDGRSTNAVSGETVRVCNPCVPDPNYSLPPQDHDMLLRHNSFDDNVRGRLPRGDTSQLVSAAQVASRYRSSPSQSLRLNSGHGIQHYHSRTHRSAYSSSVIPSTATIPHTPADLLQASYSQRRSTVSSGVGPPRHHMLDSSARVLSHTNALYGELPASVSPEQPYLSRVQPAEEDECPVCGHELPTHNASDDDAARARHIDECIRSYGSLPARSNLPAAPRSTPDVPSFTRLTTNPTAQGTLDAVIASARSLTPSFTSSSAQIALTQAIPATSFQRRAPRMLDYKASEKDCVDDRGEQQECVICFEEFEVGDNMGRLECLCKFHRKCIVGWWRAKDATNANSRTSAGQGSAGCPTHVLQI